MLMKYLKTIPCMFLMIVGCSGKNSISYPPFEYESVEQYHISWTEIFDVQSDYYYSYIYSRTCGHCKEIKELVIKTAFDHPNLIYFTIYSDEIPVVENNESMIGKSSVNELGIIGTPTLFEIKEHKVTNIYTGATSISIVLNQVI